MSSDPNCIFVKIIAGQFPSRKVYEDKVVRLDTGEVVIRVPAVPTARGCGKVVSVPLPSRTGAQIVRVHDVFETVQARNVWRGLRDAALTDFSDLPG